MTMTKSEKQAYHKRYYQQNIKHLQALARIRYWALEYNLKNKVTDRRKTKTRIKATFIKGPFVLYFD